jgi:ABC-type uncharacterized transport system fused permease/ATPase subunit
VLDGLAARLAAERAGELLRGTLLRALEVQRIALDPWDSRLWTEGNVSFHQAIAEAAQNRYLVQLLPVMRLTAQMFYPKMLLNRERADAALERFGLAGLAARNARVLSGGEQQRLAIARALLAKPDWLFLDEATAALDEPTEEAIYAMLAEKLPDTTIVSIGHRSTLHAFHERRVEMRPAGDGLFSPVDARAPVPAQ